MANSSWEMDCTKEEESYMFCAISLRLGLEQWEQVKGADSASTCGKHCPTVKDSVAT